MSSAYIHSVKIPVAFIGSRRVCRNLREMLTATVREQRRTEAVTQLFLAF